jgi:SpoVK/Ycf46/Vps4 family AAA+-type ATPase
MATGSQLVALLRSYIDSNEEHFYAIALQIAASEARKGHNAIAKELKELVDQAKTRNITFSQIKEPTPLAKPRGELASLLMVNYPEDHLSRLVLSPEVLKSLERIILEHRKADKLLHYGKSPRNKVLLVGPPGTGKTMTARVLAGELRLPLFTIRLESLITKFMGETASKLRLVFDSIAQCPGIYLFDEFDAIGGKRDASNDVGEMRRVLNSFLQLMEEGSPRSIVIGATNHPELLDKALFRRFNDVIEYKLPTIEDIKTIIIEELSPVEANDLNWDRIVPSAEGLSQAEIVRATEEVIKSAILHDEFFVNTENLIFGLEERRTMRDTISGLSE